MGAGARPGAASPTQEGFDAPRRAGRKAPTFALPDQDSKIRRLRDYAGRPLILYFYPKDDTPGCTREACVFRDALPAFKKGRAAVLGVSVLDTARASTS